MVSGIKKLGHVCLGTSKLETMVDFYSNVFGFPVIHRFKTAGGECYGVFLCVGNGTFLEFFNDDKPDLAQGRFRHLCFEVENIKGWAAGLIEKGYMTEIRRGKTDGVLQCWIDDPDGNRIEFHEYDENAVQYPYLV